MATELTHTAIPLPLEELAAFCRKWKIAKLEVFGSILTDQFRPDSDIDFLYTWADDATCGWEFFDLIAELGRIVGRKVDMVSRPQLERSREHFFRDEALRHTLVVYES
ncbi:MAG: nucleotidyltransferase domain-containing protein [bacterium]